VLPQCSTVEPELYHVGNARSRCLRSSPDFEPVPPAPLSSHGVVA